MIIQLINIQVKLCTLTSTCGNQAMAFHPESWIPRCYYIIFTNNVGRTTQNLGSKLNFEI